MDKYETLLDDPDNMIAIIGGVDLHHTDEGELDEGQLEKLIKEGYKSSIVVGFNIDKVVPLIDPADIPQPKSQTDITLG